MEGTTYSKLLNIVVIIALAVAVPLTVFIAQQQQETRQRASSINPTCTPRPTCPPETPNCLKDIPEEAWCK